MTEASSPARRSRTPWIAAVLVVVLAAGAAGGYAFYRSDIGKKDQAARASAAAFVAAWRSRSVAGVNWDGTTGAAMQTEYAAAVAGMGGLRPAVQLQAVDRSGAKATATISVSWPLSSSASWAYRSTVYLDERGGHWLVNPDGVAGASIFAPITRDSRLSLARVQPQRADVTGKGGTPIVSTGTVVDVGIEPSRVTDAASLVHRVASITGVDAGPLAKAVAAASPDAFVPVITLRESDYVKVSSKLQPLKGTVFRSRRQSLGLTRDFARALLGTVGPVTAEIVSGSDGRYAAGDYAGVSGLQRMYDARLAGTSSYTVSEVPKTLAIGADPGTSATVLYTTPSTTGQPVATTLDVKVQQAADASLAGLKVPGALVAVDVRTGAVLAVANTPSNGLDRAVVGQYPPGSTLKVATTLALLQGGLTPTTSVNCPPTATVDGRTFRNYEHETFGKVPFTVDFANSCNTAFVGLSSRLKDGDLHAAALQLGLGGSWGAGLGAGPQTFTGSVPVNTSNVDKAASAFGQGRTLTSPLALAVAAGTVARGKFIAPTLVTTPAAGAATGAAAGPTPPAKVIATLHTLMRKVVTSGTAAGKLDGVPGGPIYAKTGTAEFGSGANPQTHAWLMGWQGDIAFCAFVEVGPSGATAAGPVVRDFLTRVHG